MKNMYKVIATTRNGKLRGIFQKGYENQSFYAFKGIPYAKPPVGQLRFRDPEPAESWNGIRNAISYGSCCANIDFFTNRLQGNDDCLYLNVFTKDMKFQVGRPVIVWVHAGIFMFGSGDDFFYGPEYLMRKDVVFVTLNYRLGIFGFLNLDDQEASGNQGMKDQVLALQWVRDNIANFGGDPNNVTIAGISAGSSSVHYLTMSPLTKGLFHKAILQSGVALNPWAFFSKPKERAYQLCDYLGHSTRNSKSIIKFLRTIDAQQLAVAQQKILTTLVDDLKDRVRFEHTFGPSIDSTSVKPFMPINPEIAAAESINVPLLIGHTSREGLFYKKAITEGINRFDKEFDECLHPNIINTFKSIYNLTIRDIKRIYFNEDSISAEHFENLIELYGDLQFVEGIHRVIRIQAEKSSSPTYFYKFSYDKTSSPTTATSDARKRGASHGKELPFLFKMRYSGEVFENVENDPEKRQISKQVIDMWVNFAATGNPTPKTTDLIPLLWQPILNDNMVFRYLDIGENLRMDTMPNLEQRYRKTDSIE